MAKRIKIVNISVGSKGTTEPESQLERLVNDGWVIVGQCADGSICGCFWVTLQKG